MVNINPNHLKKQELLCYLTGRCKHGHSYLEHPNCFKTEILFDGKKVKLGFFDIEFANSFKGQYGIILSYAIKEYEKKVFSQHIKQKHLRSDVLDKELLKSLLKRLKEFDIIVTYYGTKCDLPYVRTRCLRWGFSFIPYGYLKHIDMYYIVKSKLSLNRNTLENACHLLGIKGKNHVDGETWVKAVTGNKKALMYIREHNERDVVILEELYNKLINYYRRTNRSI